MARKLKGDALIVASHNAGKVREINALIGPFGLEARSASALDLTDPEETGSSFEENALLKAASATKATGLPALSDDSGFCVAALNGEPGIYSARWAGPKKDFTRAMRIVMEKFQSTGSKDLTSSFIACLCLAWPDGHYEMFRGEVNGKIVWPPRGALGFGYDPMFQPDGWTRTFGEMNAQEKHGWSPIKPDCHRPPLSHRARAFKRLAEQCLMDAR